MKRDLGASYSPLYFLAALGNGGLAVSFYMYLMFMVPHKGTPMATFDHIMSAITTSSPVIGALIVIALLGIVWFAIQHIRLLIWNVREYRLFKTTEAYEKLKNSNAEVTLMTMPLTFAMTINVMFILGGAFVPGLWSIVQYLFPVALIAFGIVAYYGLKIFSIYFTRLIVNGDFDFVNNNSLAQAIAIFAFAMIGVGFAAPGAMSHSVAISAIGLFGATFFATISVSLAIVKLTLGLKSIFRQGISLEAAPSLWIFIPILTILGITAVRMIFGFYHNMIEAEPSPAFMFLMTSAIMSLQLMFGVVGYMVLKQIGYFKEFIHGEKKSAGSYALICPGVAFFVFGFFFISWGLVYPGVIEKFSPVYFALIVPLVYVQYVTIKVILKLNTKLLKV
jgi:hypothetical protein